MRRSYVLFYTAQGFDVHIITRSSEDGDWMDGSRSEARFRRQAAMDERLRGFFRLFSFQLAALSKILHVQIECNFLK